MIGKRKPKRTRKNPNRPDKETLANQRLPWKMKYAGDVKQLYKLSVREAAVAFTLLQRTVRRNGGKCGCSYRMIEGLGKELCTNVGHVLEALRKKGVLESCRYDNSGSGYFTAVIAKEFAARVKASRHFSFISLYDFNLETMTTTTLSDRIFLQVARYVYNKFGQRYASVLASFIGCSKNTVLSKLKDARMETWIEVVADTCSADPRDVPYVIRFFDDQAMKRSQFHDEFCREIELCLWRYEFSASTMYYDDHGRAALIKAADDAYTKVIAKAKKILAMPLEKELKIRAAAVKWLRTYGPGSKTYEDLRTAYATVAEMTGDPAIPAVNLRPVVPDKMSNRILGHMFGLYDTTGTFYVPLPVKKDDVRLDPSGRWMLASEKADASEEDGKKIKLVSIEDLF